VARSDDILERSEFLSAISERASVGGQANRDRYHHGDLRAALVAAGRELLAERGLHGFTLRECARRAGVTHAAPAHHFPTVGDLLAEIAATGFEDLSRSMAKFADAADPDDARGHLIGLGRGYVAFALSNPAVIRLMFRRETFTFTAERFVTAARTAFSALVQGVDGVLPAGSPEERGRLVEAAWSLVHGFATLVIDGQICKEETDLAAINERAAGILEDWLRGVAPGAIKSPPVKGRPRQKA
jgi:AcrR family transcriptional regulator